MQPVSMQARSVRHTSELRACALSVIPAPPLRHSRAPIRHSCALSVIPAQAGIQASWLGSRTAPMLDGLRSGPSPRSDGLVARRRDGGVGRPAAGASEQARCSPCPCRRDRFDTLRASPAGRDVAEGQRLTRAGAAVRPCARSVIPSARSVIPAPLSVIPAPPSVIPAQAGIQASRLGSRTAPMLYGLP